MYRDQVRWAAEEGADFILSETNDYVGEALIGLEVIREHGLPSVVTFASSEDRRSTASASRRPASGSRTPGPTSSGSTARAGPQTMLPLLERVRAAVSCPIAGQPVPYRTTAAQTTFQALRDDQGRRVFPIALDPFTCTRFDMADFAVAARDIGVRFIGICCGGAPHHVRAMAEALGRTVPASRYSPDLSLHPVLGEPSRGHRRPLHQLARRRSITRRSACRRRKL